MTTPPTKVGGFAVRDLLPCDGHTDNPCVEVGSACEKEAEVALLTLGSSFAWEQVGQRLWRAIPCAGNCYRVLDNVRTTDAHRRYRAEFVGGDGEWYLSPERAKLSCEHHYTTGTWLQPKQPLQCKRLSTDGQRPFLLPTKVGGFQGQELL